MHVTALDVALASAAATAIAAVAAPTASWLIAKGGRDHERQLARKARNFEARRSVYEDAAIEAADGIAAMGVWVGRIEVEAEAYKLHSAPEWAPNSEGTQLRGRLVAISSEAVVESWTKYAEAATAFWQKALDIEASGFEGDVIPATEAEKLRPLLDVAISARERFERDARRDLLGS